MCMDGRYAGGRCNPSDYRERVSAGTNATLSSKLYCRCVCMNKRWYSKLFFCSVAYFQIRRRSSVLPAVTHCSTTVFCLRILYDYFRKTPKPHTIFWIFPKYLTTALWETMPLICYLFFFWSSFTHSLANIQSTIIIFVYDSKTRNAMI